MERLLHDPADSARSALRLDAGTRTTIRARRTWTRSALAALAVSVALLAAGVSSAAAAPAATATATGGCWLAVVNDWLDNNRVDRVYAVPCYTQAIQQLNKYPDVQNYSSAAEDIQRALLAAIRQDRGPGPGSGPGGSGGPGTGGGTGGGTSPGGGTGSSGGVLGAFSPSNAQSIPLPLLVLGGLALLLLAAAGATLVARRVQARRVAPRPAPAPAVDKRG